MVVSHDVRRLFASALVTVALLVPQDAHAVPVNPTPAATATFNGPVHAVTHWGNTIYVGGEFTHATTAEGVRVRRSRLAAIDAMTGALLPWAPAADGTVIDLAADATGLYVAGDFRVIDLQSRHSLAKLDLGTGAVLPAFQHRIYGHPNALALGHGRVYVVGTLTSVNGIKRSRVAAFDAMTGALDLAWAPNVSGPVYSVLAAPDRIYLGGMFDSINAGSKTQKLAAVRPDTGEVDATFVSRVHAFVSAMSLQGDTLYAGIDGDGGRMSALDLSGTPKWTVTVDGDVQAIAVLGDTVYLGGHFDNVCKTDRVGPVDGLRGSHCLEGVDRRVKLAAFDLAGALQPWVADGSGVIGVRTLMANPGLGQLVAGGHFRYINGLPQRRFALFKMPV